MTRHTRNRQIELLKGKDYRDPFATPIPIMFLIYKQRGKLDRTFTWHRNFEGWGDNKKSKTCNVIEFGGDKYTYGSYFPVKTNWRWR